MSETSAAIACVYCGARHSRAVDVRACWERSTQPGASSFPGTRRVAIAEQAPAAAPAGAMGPVLGRSVVVASGQTPPVAWALCDRAGGGIDQLEQAWRERTPLVIEVGDETPSDEVERGPVWSLSPLFAFPGERRSHFTFANAIDARDGANRWHLAEEAVRLGATAGGPADVVLADGRPAYCDGGPLQWHGAVGEAAVVPSLSLLAGSLVPFGSNSTDALLAPDQLAAVTHPGGAARIIAPAGSGKTRVLTERARHLLRRWNVPGTAVTLVAFNKRAADEMRERTPDLPELQVRTLNALGLSLVTRSEPATTIDEREVRSILDTLVDLPRRANTDPAAAWIEALSAVRLGLQSPAEVEAQFGGDVDGLARVFESYRRLLADRRVVDFDEQIYRAIEIFLTDPGARRSARATCRLLLVDEFQDLTPAHLLLIRLLAGPEGAVFGVGDDDQTIYGYSGASPEWLIDY
ncbi:MAG: UvrD-helicase domain-containing protein [Acidimicrobiales bacterium]